MLNCKLAFGLLWVVRIVPQTWTVCCLCMRPGISVLTLVWFQKGEKTPTASQFVNIPSMRNTELPQVTITRNMLDLLFNDSDWRLDKLLLWQAERLWQNWFISSFMQQNKTNNREEMRNTTWAHPRRNSCFTPVDCTLGWPNLLASGAQRLSSSQQHLDFQVWNREIPYSDMWNRGW